MDIRTGRTYETYEDALNDGVPSSDIARMTVRDGQYWPRFERSKYKETHQSTREMARRKRQLSQA